VGTDSGGIPGESSNPSFSSDSITLAIGFGHTGEMSDCFLLGLDSEYSSLPKDTNLVGVSDSNLVNASVFDHHLTISSRPNLCLSPGRAIDDTKLAHLKLGYSNRQIQYAQNNRCSAPSNKARVDGYLIGLRYKQMISASSFNGRYRFVEPNSQAYSQADLDATYSDGVAGRTTASRTRNSYNVLLWVDYKF
jgi:hypothetical protein